MRRIIEEKAKTLNFDQFVQEAVLGKIASDIYNEAKKIAALRHVGIRKTKLLSKPEILEVKAIEKPIEAAEEAQPEGDESAETSLSQEDAE